MWDMIERFRTGRIDSVQTLSHVELGRYGESLAVKFLRLHGYRIVMTNFVTPIGYSRKARQITGEIDLIAYDESSRPFHLAFIEVKTRTSAEIAAPESAVDRRKQRQIVRAARIYRRWISVEDEPYRYDVVSILLAPRQRATITLMRNYFTEQRFERSRWFSVENQFLPRTR